jgi:hypothetical protein
LPRDGLVRGLAYEAHQIDRRCMSKLKLLVRVKCILSCRPFC